MTGVHELVFVATRMPSEALVTHYRIRAPLVLPPDWSMAFSTTTGLPYFVNATTGTRTYVPPELKITE